MVRVGHAAVAVVPRGELHRVVDLPGGSVDAVEAVHAPLQLGSEEGAHPGVAGSDGALPRIEADRATDVVVLAVVGGEEDALVVVAEELGRIDLARLRIR